MNTFNPGDLVCLKGSDLWGIVLDRNNHWFVISTVAGSSFVWHNDIDSFAEKIELSGEQIAALALVHYYERIEPRGVLCEMLSGRANMLLTTLQPLLQYDQGHVTLNGIGRIHANR